jgi:hypothetical protein
MLGARNQFTHYSYRKEMKQFTKSHAFQVYVVVGNVETLDDGWCAYAGVRARARVCVCVWCACVCVVCEWANARVVCVGHVCVCVVRARVVSSLSLSLFLSVFGREAHFPLFCMPPLFLRVKRSELESNHSPIFQWLKICGSIFSRPRTHHHDMCLRPGLLKPEDVTKVCISRGDI